MKMSKYHLLLICILPCIIDSFIWMEKSWKPKFITKLFSDSDEISCFKAKELKQILQANNVNTKSLFEKKELEEALKNELQLWNVKYKSIHSLPLQNIQYGSPPKDYTVITITINGQNLKFIIDTGSSINILKANVFKTLSIQDNNSASVYSQGVGGGGKVNSDSVNSNEIKMLSIQIKSSASTFDYSLPFVLIDNIQFFPAEIAGLLGINFLENVSNGVGDGINLNYKQQLFEFGKLDSLLSPIIKWKSKRIKLQRIQPNLLTCDVFITSHKSKETVFCQGLIDLGSASTIVNIPTILAFKEDPLQLDVSPLTTIGIDNRPMRVSKINFHTYLLALLLTYFSFLYLFHY